MVHGNTNIRKYNSTNNAIFLYLPYRDIVNAEQSLLLAEQKTVYYLPAYRTFSL